MFECGEAFRKHLLNMINFPDFSANGYQVIEELGHNIQGGRITYKAIEIASQKTVIIKQFRFATTRDWNSYKAIEREIQVLQGLNHRGIPKYLNQFDSDLGLCLVQEYINAQPLSTSRSFSPDDIKSIAIQILEILVYLQEERIPPVFHQDIKPENVLLDNNLRVYLIDFGTAKIGSDTMALSSIGGTMGFMPPEQIRNLKPTESSDLYSVGATLICLITQTKSIDIGSLVNFDSNKFTFTEKVPKFSFRFIQWLERMVEPNPTNRYPNALSALSALQPLYVTRVPEVTLEITQLEFIAEKVGQKLTKTLEITNNIPDTVLEGKWSVFPHPNDPPHTPDNHLWIRCTPQRVKGNKSRCNITVDTSKLKAAQSYQRDLVFTSNANPENFIVKIKVETAPFNFNVPFPSYSILAIYLLTLILISGGLSFLKANYIPNNIIDNNFYLLSTTLLFFPFLFTIFIGVITPVSKAVYLAFYSLIYGTTIFGCLSTLALLYNDLVFSLKIWIFGMGWSLAIFLFTLLRIHNQTEKVTSIVIDKAFKSPGIEQEIIESLKVSWITTLINNFSYSLFFLPLFLLVMYDPNIFLELFSREIVSLNIILAGLGFLFLICWQLYYRSLKFIASLISYLYKYIFLRIERRINKIGKQHFFAKGFNSFTVFLYIFFTSLTSLSFGVGATISFTSLISITLAFSSFLLTIIFLYPFLKLRYLKRQYRRQEANNLIKS